ncbi:unnamed protein product [Calypogeia fissa]
MDQGLSRIARKLNDSIYELHHPSGVPTVEVVFFHGFQIGNYEDAHLSAWESADGAFVWPETWLVEEYPGAHILSVSYSAVLSFEDMDLCSIEESLLSDLNNAFMELKAPCPVILVGHGFGGMLIKRLLQHAHYKHKLDNNHPYDYFLKKVKGLFFYSTPGSGGFPNWVAESLSHGPLLRFVQTLNSGSYDRINQEFERIFTSDAERMPPLEGYSLLIAGVGEILPTKLGQSLSVIVPKESSRERLHEYAVISADHISVCKPRNKIARSFNALTRFLKKVIEASKGPDTESVAEPEAYSPSGKDEHQDSHQEEQLSKNNEQLANTPHEIGNYQHLPESIFGINDTLAKIRQMLGNFPELGISGMGGIGKTTLAKRLFNDLQKGFDYTCFVNDVKSIEQLSVQDAMLKCMHDSEGKKVPQGKVGLGNLKGKTLLLVLDDVASEKDLEIIPVLKAYGVHADGLFVATSRNSELLKLYLGEVYPVSFLSPEIARQLLETYAFRTSVIPPSFERFLDDVLVRCEGLPLTIEVVGKYLYDKKSELIWEQVTTALDEAKEIVGWNERLWTRLRQSYDRLGPLEQQMFLDAATVFYNADLDLAKAAWSITTNGSQDMIWQRLLDSSFVSESRTLLDYSNNFSSTPTKIGIHEQLLSLGRRIASSSGENGLRIWDIKKSTNLNLRGDSLKDIVALKMSSSDLQIMEDHSDEESNEGVASAPEERIPALLASAFGKMGKMQYLFLEGMHIDQIYGAALPSTLVSLQLSRANFTDLPFKPSRHKRLAVLILTSCHQLRTLPATFGQLASLQVLHICKCYSLRSLPDELGDLVQLKHLEIETCNILRRLPHSLGGLVALKQLILRDCKALRFLPESLGGLRSLKAFVIDSCDLIETLPETLDTLEALEDLSLSHCKSLSSLPDALGKLRRLQKLTIQSCPVLGVIPEALGTLEALKYLSLSNCEALSSVPDTAKIEKVNIWGCRGVNIVEQRLKPRIPLDMEKL